MTTMHVSREPLMNKKPLLDRVWDDNGDGEDQIDFFDDYDELNVLNHWQATAITYAMGGA